MRHLLLIAILSASCSLHAFADVYVNNLTGSDLNDGLSPTTLGRGTGPARTIAKALRLARPADRLIIANTGVAYQECVTLTGANHSGISTLPFVIEGNGAVLDGAVPVPPLAWKHWHDDTFRFRPMRKGWAMLFLDGVPAPRQFSPDVYSVPPLRPLSWSYVSGDIYFRSQDGALPEDFDLAFAKERVGLTLYRVKHVVIKDLIVQGFQLDGINAHDMAVDVTLQNLTLRGNGRSGLSVGGSSRVQIETSLVGNNGEAQIRTEGYSHTRIINCDVLDNTAPPVVREGGEVDWFEPN